MADLKDKTCESDLFLESKKIKDNARHDSAGGYDVGSTKMRISSSGISDYQASESVIDNVHGSTLVHEDDKQSSEGIVSEQPTSAKSDVSVEIGLNAGSLEMDGLNTMTHDSKQRTESSCSNSLSVVLPVSFSNHSYLDSSKEPYSITNCGGSADSSTSKGSDPRLEEPVTTSSESVISAQIARNAITNTRAMSSMKISSMVENCGSSPSKKGDEEILHDGAVEVSMKDRDKFIAGFDLNEEIDANEMDDYIQPVVATTLSHSVIHVIAKAGIPNGRPVFPLKFEGELGWKGSAETSAFRPTRSRYRTSKESRGFRGIDLNVAAVEDSATNGSPLQHHGISPPPTLQDSRSEVDAKRAKSLWFDLNHSYDDADEFPRHSLPAKSQNPPSVDLNLNANASMANKTSHSTNPGKRDSNFTSCEAKNAHTIMAAPNIFQPTELMQRVASLQQKSSFMSHPLPPPHYYPSMGPFHFTSRDPMPIPLSGVMPYARYSHEHGIFPQALNQNTVYTSLGPRHLVQVFPNEQHVKTEINSSTSENKMDESRKFSFPSGKDPTGETMHQETWCAKRKEPEGGGLECYYKKMI